MAPPTRGSSASLLPTILAWPWPSSLNTRAPAPTSPPPPARKSCAPPLTLLASCWPQDVRHLDLHVWEREWPHGVATMHIVDAGEALGPDRCVSGFRHAQ